MCLILFAYQVHPQFPLIVAANRDEFINRPTATAHYWEDSPYVLAGRDLEKMGTWMGVSKKDGKFAALTNYRDPNQPLDGKRSRGELVTNFLINNQSINQYGKKLQATKEEYPGYNIIFGNHDHLYYYSNVSNDLKLLTPGIYGLSNHLLNTDWPKVVKGKKQLFECVNDKSLNVDSLFQILTDRTKAPDHLLPNTGVSTEWERTLSPLFIQTDHYGTMCSTVLTLSKGKDVTFIERSFTNGSEFDEQSFTFTID